LGTPVERALALLDDGLRSSQVEERLAADILASHD
jgi:hypothetical protein